MIVAIQGDNTTSWDLYWGHSDFDTFAKVLFGKMHIVYIVTIAFNVFVFSELITKI